MLISISKSFTWFFLLITLVIAFSSLSPQETEMLQKRFFWLFFIVALISLVLHFIPVIGYAHDGRGLQGIFNHPQKLGIIFSLLSSALLIILLNQKIFSLKTIFFLIVLIFYLTLIFLSASRTAVFSFFLSVLIFIFCSIFFRKQNFLKTYNFLRNKNFRILSIVLLFFAIFFYYYYYTFFLNFFDKGQNSKNILDAYLNSRMPALSPVIENIKTSWLTGIGFGLPSLQNYSSDNEISYTFFRHFHYEKGNLFLLVLEELGVLGFLIFILWLFFLIRVTILSSNNIALIVIINIILLNLGEAVLFSTGGLGLFTLIFLCWAATRSNLSSKKSHENFS
jgi:O-antigen ligase